MPEFVRRGYSERQVSGMGFPAKDYAFPTGEGSFTGTLVMKKWNGKNALICYFDADDGAKYKLCVWFSYDVNRTYRPTNSTVDISYVDIGSTIKVAYGQTKNGKSKWLDAEVLR